MGTHMIPRNTKGEGRILYIFSVKALIYSVIGAIIGTPVYFMFKAFNADIIGLVFLGILGLIGFLIGTVKVPSSERFSVTRLVGGENIDDIIIRYYKFKKNKNKIYTTKEEE